MFQYIVAGITAAIFGGIAIHEATKPTGEKVKNGDAVFVRADALHPADLTSTADTLGLRAFLAGFLSTAIKVSAVKTNGKADMTGTILGFSKSVGFPSTAVVSIERNGKRIT